MEKYHAATSMQDGAPCHAAKLIVDWFNFCYVSILKPWSANSPDLNAIENLWPYVKVKLKDRITSSLPRLQTAIQHIRDNIDPQYLHHLADSLPKKLQKVKSGWLATARRVLRSSAL